MLLEQLSKLFRQKSEPELTLKSSESLESSASSPAPSQGLLNSQSWKTKAREQLIKHEGEVLHAYQDHLGFWTIGVGRLIDKRKGGGLSKEESAYLLDNDINNRLSALQDKLPWFGMLNDARKAVLLNMSFQLGIAGLMGFSKTLSLIQNGYFDEAAANMLKSKWATQTPGRAKEMAEQMRTGTWQSG